MKGRAWLMALFLAPGASFAAEVTVSLKMPGPRAYAVDGSFSVVAASSTAWEVLTDYEHLGSFVPDLKSSVVRERRPGRVLLDQEAVGRFLLFARSVRVLLEVIEEPMSRLSFRDVLGRDFETYGGRWTLLAGPDGFTRVSYRLEAVPKISAPGVVTRAALKRAARRLLDQVRQETLRRERAQQARIK